MNIEQKTLEIITQITQKKVNLGDELIITGLIDSISAMDLMVAIKEQLNVEIPFDQIVDIFSSTNSLIDYITKNYKG